MIPIRYFRHPLATVAPRDLLLLESLNPRPTDAALEVGVGSGSSLLRLAGLVATIDGLDIAEAPVERLREAFRAKGGAAARIGLFALDFCDPATPDKLPTRYDLIFSCDSIEHVPDPGAFLANVHKTLKPGGRAFLTYPNEHPDHAHGITFLERRSDLEGLLAAAGFASEKTTIEVVEISAGARRVLRMGWRLPRSAVKKALKLLRRRRGPAKPPPQTFDQTDFHAASRRLEPFAAPINAYCWAVMKVMSLAKPVYHIGPAPEIIWDTQILIRAEKSA